MRQAEQRRRQNGPPITLGVELNQFGTLEVQGLQIRKTLEEPIQGFPLGHMKMWHRQLDDIVEADVDDRQSVIILEAHVELVPHKFFA
ncbi:hypothetical protein D9M71_739620 [compost metagenome]